MALKDNSSKVLSLFNSNVLKTLEALGLTATELTKINITSSKYGKPVVDTGTLRDSITHEVIVMADAVKIGTNVEYAENVHNGTSKMKSRPYLKDAILENKEVYKEIVAENMSKGF